MVDDKVVEVESENRKHFTKRLVKEQKFTTVKQGIYRTKKEKITENDEYR